MSELETDNLVRSSNDSILRVYLQRILVCILLIIMIIMIYFGNRKIQMNLSFGQSAYSHMNFQNVSDQNRSSFSHTEFDVVLSYYAEDVNFVARFIQYLRNTSTLQKLKSRIIVYNKNSKINNTYLKTILKADIVQQLPNLGREGGTYLHHIVTNYDILANHILFCQAGVEGITNTGLTDWFFDRLEKQFNSSVGYMPLVENRWFTTFDCGVRTGENIQQLPELWGIIEQTLCPPGGQAVAFRGQFLVSAKRIRNRPLRIYKYINELITANTTHWLHTNPRSKLLAKSTPDNPNFGHVVERVWTTLFNCTNPNLIDRCRRNECACFD